MDAGGLPDAASEQVDAARIPPLTPRQTEVARLVADGLSNKELAARLGIADATVERHLVNIFRTLGIGSRTKLAAWVRSAAR